MKQHLYQKAYELLAQGRRLILAKTVRRSGSTPRDVGAMCLVTDAGELIGTIGGGLMEFQVQTRAVDLLNEQTSLIYPFRLSDADLADAGMVCGGEVDLYLDPLFPENPETRAVFQAMAETIEKKEPATLVTRVDNGLPALAPGNRMLIPQNHGETIGAIPGFDTARLSETRNRPFSLMAQDGSDKGFFVETIGLKPRVLLFGGGHVSVFVARLAKMVGFAVSVIDDRPEFVGPDRFPDADERIVSDFDKAFDRIDVSPDAYILIITRGHLHDRNVLQQALNTPAGYIGMIGSTRKRDLIYRDLMNQGVSKERLAEVFSPVGLDIHAETPEEIAVSIVAQLIWKRSPGKKTRNLLT